MDWSNEPYVRMYTRETTDDIELSWEALALWRALLCKFDRSGLMEARNGWTSVARATRMPMDVVERAGAELIRDGRVRLVKAGVFAPNYVAAQTASKSDRVRQRESRDRRRDRAVAMQDIESAQHSATESQPVTSSHTPSQNVTLTSADPLLSRCDAEPLLGPRDRHAETPGFDRLVDAVHGATGDVGAKRAEPVLERRSQKRVLLEGWKPTRSEASLKAEAEAKARGVNVDVEFEKFVDWTKSSNAKKADWDATWRNWLRNSKPQSSQQSIRIPQSGGLRAADLLEGQLQRVRDLEDRERESS